MRGPVIPLAWRLFVANAAVLIAAATILLLSPITVSHPVSAHEAAVVVGGVCALLVVNLWIGMRTLAPLRRLADDMDRTDLLDEGGRVPRQASADAEIVRLADSYQAMLDRLRSERRESARRAAAAQEEERRHVARELHDQVGQALTGLVLQIDRLSADLGPERGEHVIPVREAARDTLEDVRQIARSLRPEVLDELGLVPALHGLARRFGRDTGVRVARRLTVPDEPLDADVELAVYRVAQEALTNVARHAGAATVELTLAPRDDAVELVVRDDGRGLDARPGAAGGLRWMRERAMLVGGTLSVGAGAEGGTTVRLRVPARSEVAARAGAGA